MSTFDTRGGVLQLYDDGTETELAPWLLVRARQHQREEDAGVLAFLGGVLASLLSLAVQLAFLGALITLAFSFHSRGELSKDGLLADGAHLGQIMARYGQMLGRRARSSAATALANAQRVPIVIQASEALGDASRLVRARLVAAMDAAPFRNIAAEWYEAVRPGELGPDEPDEPDETQLRPADEPDEPDEAVRPGELGPDDVETAKMLGVNENGEAHKAHKGGAMPTRRPDKLGGSCKGGGMSSTAAPVSGSVVDLRSPDGLARPGAVPQRVSFETIEGDAVDSSIDVVVLEDTYASMLRDSTAVDHFPH